MASDTMLYTMGLHTHNLLYMFTYCLLFTATGYVPPPPAIRLVGGSNDAEGRVEMFVDGQWTAICDEGWSLPDAAVACNHLGYSRSMRSSINSGMAHAYSKCNMTKNSKWPS